MLRLKSGKYQDRFVPTCSRAPWHAARTGPLARVWMALVICGFLAGCAPYRIGPQSLFDPEIRTVYVPMFESDSYRRNLGERLTEAVVKEIEQRTPYKVVSGPGADSVLSGRILGDTKRVLAETINDEPREIETQFSVRVQWLGRQQEMLGDTTIPLSPAAVSIAQGASVIPEVGRSVAVAQQEAIQEIAVQIVDLMEAPW